jgi:hypothetical protein
MPLIPAEAMPYFENMIYLPMVLIVLEKDRLNFEKGPFKLKKPYVEMVEKTIRTVQAELKETRLHLRRHHMKVVKQKSDDTFTEYVFFYGGYEEHRRYLNVRLRNRSEELLGIYLSMTAKEA